MKRILACILSMTFLSACNMFMNNNKVVDYTVNHKRLIPYDFDYQSEFDGEIIDDDYYGFPSSPPLVARNDELVVYTDKTCTKIARSIKLPGKYVSYFDGFICTISDKQYYLCSIEYNRNMEVENEQNYLLDLMLGKPIFTGRCRLINTVKLSRDFNHIICQDVDNLQTIKHFDANTGKLIYSYNLPGKVKLSPCETEQSNVNIFGCDGENIIFYQLYKDKLEPLKYIKLYRKTTDLDKIIMKSEKCFRYQKQVTNSVYDGENLYILDIRNLKVKRTIELKEYLSNLNSDVYLKKYGLHYTMTIENKDYGKSYFYNTELMNNFKCSSISNYKYWMSTSNVVCYTIKDEFYVAEFINQDAIAYQNSISGNDRYIYRKDYGPFPDRITGISYGRKENMYILYLYSQNHTYGISNQEAFGNNTKKEDLGIIILKGKLIEENTSKEK